MSLSNRRSDKSYPLLLCGGYNEADPTVESHLNIDGAIDCGRPHLIVDENLLALIQLHALLAGSRGEHQVNVYPKEVFLFVETNFAIHLHVMRRKGVQTVKS